MANPTKTGISDGLREMAREFIAARPRTDQIEDQENKRKILDALRESHADANARFVVEGATVVCTQMKTAPIPRTQTSESKMKKLEADVRARRMRMIARRNPGGVFGGDERSASIKDRYNAVGNEDATPQDMMDVNGRRLLTNLDIEFEPLFTKEGAAKERAMEELKGDGKKGPIYPGALERLIDQLEGCEGCKGSEDDDCKPDIEQLMWLDTDEDFALTGSDTLLMNSAYMFCHHGQGVLYIDESGQYPMRRLRPFLDSLVEVDDEEELHEEDNVDRDIVSRSEWGVLDYTQPGSIGTVPGIVVHHTDTPPTAAWDGAPESIQGRVNSIDNHHRNNVENPDGTRGWSGGIGYHFLIGTDGSIFEGRLTGWIGAHAGDIGKNHYIGIAVIGSYHPASQFFDPDQPTPPQPQLNTLFWLIRKLRRDIPTIEDIVIHHDRCPGPWFDNHNWDELL